MKQQLKTFPDGYYGVTYRPVEASVTIPYLRINGEWCYPTGYKLEIFSLPQLALEGRVHKIDSFLELLNSQVSRRDKKDLCLRL
jgi:hypothetical protein